MATPFDPFSYDDDDQFTPGSNTIPAGKSTSASHPGSPAVSYSTSRCESQSFTTATSRTMNTTKKQPVHDGPSKVLALPPRMNVRLSLHEDVSSSAIKDGNGGISMSQLFVEGKIVVSL